MEIIYDAHENGFNWIRLIENGEVLAEGYQLFDYIYDNCDKEIIVIPDRYYLHYLIKDLYKDYKIKMNLTQRFAISWIKLGSNYLVPKNRWMPLNYSVDYIKDNLMVEDKRTFGAMGMSLYTKLYPYHYYQFRNKLTIEEFSVYKEAYYGNLLWSKYGTYEDINYFDIVSSFPYLMYTSKLPYKKDENGTYHIYKVFVDYAKTDGIEFVDIINGVLYIDSVLLPLFEKYYYGKWKIVKLESFAERYGIFDKYINKLWPYKEKGGIQGDIAKMLLNVLHGKFAQDPRKFTNIRLSDDYKTHRYLKFNGIFYNYIKPNKVTVPFVPLDIKLNSLQRKRLIEAFKPIEEDVVYLAADGFYTKNNAMIKVGNEFGDFKHKGYYKEGHFKQVHMYGLSDGTIKAAGFPEVRELSYEEFKERKNAYKTFFEFSDNKIIEHRELLSIEESTY